MARMTAQDIVTEVRLHLGGETDETVSDNQILRWINRSYIELASTYGFEELETSTSVTTVSGTAEYAVPSTGQTDILVIHSIIDDTNNNLLRPWSRYQYDMATQGDSSNVTGQPIFWFFSGVGTNTNSYTVRQITLYPTPDGAYTLNVVYRKKPAELVLTPSATSSILLEPFDDTLVLKAVSRGWRALGDDDKSYKAVMAARESEKYALRSAGVASAVPYPITSMMANSLR
jgi:hypothetical protein